MTFFGKKPQTPALRKTENLLAAAEKVDRYRGDLFSEKERERFDAAVADARAAAAGTPPDAEKLAAAADALEKALLDLGGTFFPKKTLPEWVELLVVAAILAGGIRAFFIQPFKIPTNSMFPTYNGMTSVICTGTENGRLISTPRCAPSAPSTIKVAVATPSARLPLSVCTRLASAR